MPPKTMNSRTTKLSPSESVVNLFDRDSALPNRKITDEDCRTCHTTLTVDFEMTDEQAVKLISAIKNMYEAKDFKSEFEYLYNRLLILKN